MSIEAPPAVDDLPGIVIDQAAPPLNRREKKKVKKAEKKTEREALVADHLAKIHEQSYPNENERLAKYDFPFMVLAGANTPINLDQAVEFAKMWNSDPPYANREVEKRIREAAMAAKREVAPLKKSRFSSLRNSLGILTQGELPTTSKMAALRLEEEDDVEKKEKLEDLRDQLWISEKTKGRHSSGFVVFVGGTYGNGLLSGGPNGGIVFEPRDPETKKRKHDAFLSVKGKAVLPGGGPVVGIHKHGLEKFYSILGLTYSSGHPYRDEQVRLKFPLVETSFGKLSGATHEAPLLFYAPIAYMLGMPEVAHSIYSLGFPHYLFAKPHIGLDVQDERLRPVQEKIAKYSARAQVRLEPINSKVSELLEPIKQRLPRLPGRKKGKDSEPQDSSL
jgi:hypothetical protein